MSGKNAVKIIEHIGVLREGKNGWTQEFNLVSWYGGEPKYDVRWWSKNKTESGKGSTLRFDEITLLQQLIVELPERLVTVK